MMLVSRTSWLCTWAAHLSNNDETYGREKLSRERGRDVSGLLLHGHI